NDQLRRAEGAGVRHESSRLVPHAVGRNMTAAPRIMAYFRVSHVNHASHRLAALRDPWLDFPPLAERVR
ncbi:hypothetical protein C1A38_06210, partial [Verrucosispora sp. ts21]